MERPDNKTPYKASEYDNNVKATIPFYEMFHSETIDLVKTIKPKAKCWLDTGCGTGILVEKAFSQFHHTFFILADPSKKMLLQARERLRSFPSERIRFIDSVGSENLWENLTEQPEVITAIMCHHYFKPGQRRNAVKVCFDSLAPGGIFITFENIYPDSEKNLEIGLRCWKEFQLSQGRSPEKVVQHLDRFNKEYFPIHIGEHIKLLRECGFSTCELFWYSQMQAGFYAIKQK
ncbi:MAG: class I SAM-dependent methyltransferase [Sedimentisphaerales bacterium]|jgi:tRNA (cmo5U34)-methyltransferase